MNERQRTFLLTGLLDRFGRGEPGFESDAAARAAWFRWRADLLEDRDFTVNDPGHRPAAFWRFEAGLTRDAFGWRWPRGCRSEEETTYKFYADATERERPG